MKYIIRGLIISVIPIILGGLLKYVKQPNLAEDGKVYFPKFFAILGLVATAIFLIPAIIIAFLDSPLWAPICFLLLSLLPAALIVAFVNCRISYDQEGFVHKSFFGVKRKFTYDQVTAIKENEHEKFIYVGKKRLMVDALAIGGDDFIELVKKKYLTIHNGKALPRIYKTKNDIFNGNIKETGKFLFLYITVGIFAIGFLIFTICYTYIPSTPDNTLKQAISVVSCQIKNEGIVLTSTDNERFIIRFAEKSFNIKEIQDICDGEKVITTYSVKFAPKHEESYYSLKAIEYNNEYLLSFDVTNKFHIQEYVPLVIAAAALCVVWGIFIIGSIIIGRNPKKFSKRVVRLFFKDEYIRS